LQRFRARLAAEPGIRLRAVATQSLREARNGADIAAQASLALGHPVEVIDGQEEARLAWLGVASLQPGHRRRLVMDVGGRSSELVLGHGARLERAFSLPVGSVSLSRRHFAEGCFSASAFEAATAAAQAAVAPTALALGAWPRWEEALGSSGTVSAVSRVLGANGMAGPDGAVTLGALAWCRQQCEAAGEAQALHLAGLEQDRRPVMGGSIALLTGLFQALGLEAVRPARGALRNGVIFDLAQHPAA
ncbi:MAG: hypothetical protein RL722_2950, partial [Pseudomonadota bacterium]